MVTTKINVKSYQRYSNKLYSTPEWLEIKEIRKNFKKKTNITYEDLELFESKINNILMQVKQQKSKLESFAHKNKPNPYAMKNLKVDIRK